MALSVKSGDFHSPSFMGASVFRNPHQPSHCSWRRKMHVQRNYFCLLKLMIVGFHDAIVRAVK